MRKLLIVWALSVAILIPAPATAATPAAPQEVSEADGRAVRQVIEAQLKALAAGDAAKAFSYAAPAIKAQIHDAAAFIGMVKNGYPMLLQPASISFFRPETGDGAVLQGVLFRDHQGRLWHAVYQVERQPDNSWLIAGCGVVPEKDSSTT